MCCTFPLRYATHHFRFSRLCGRFFDSTHDVIECTGDINRALCECMPRPFTVALRSPHTKYSRMTSIFNERIFRYFQFTTAQQPLFVHSNVSAIGRIISISSDKCWNKWGFFCCVRPGRYYSFSGVKKIIHMKTKLKWNWMREWICPTHCSNDDGNDFIFLFNLFRVLWIIECSVFEQNLIHCARAHARFHDIVLKHPNSSRQTNNNKKQMKFPLNISQFLEFDVTANRCPKWANAFHTIRSAQLCLECDGK